MAFTIGLNFRATSGFVTDGMNETYVINDVYPITRGGVTFGWNSVTNVTTRDRTATIDRRLAGDQFSSSSTDTFQLDLPSTGLYYLWGAFGDNVNTGTLGFTIKDNTNTIATFSGSVAGGNFQDMNGTTFSTANWPANNVLLAYNFTSTTLKVAWGAGNDGLAHLRVSSSPIPAGMNKLFLHDATNNNQSAYRGMDTGAGSSLTTGVVNTALNGTEIQFTKTAGGSNLVWISPPIGPDGLTLAGTMTFNLWGKESANAANCKYRARVFKWASGTETEVAGGPFDFGSEFTTSMAAKNWTGVPTSTAFVEGNRVVLKAYITNVGTMPASQTATMDYDAGTSGSDGDSYLSLVEAPYFGPESPFTPYPPHFNALVCQ